MRTREQIQAGLPRIRSTGEALSPESAIALLIQAQVEISLDIREQNQRIVEMLTARSNNAAATFPCTCNSEPYTGCGLHGWDGPP